MIALPERVNFLIVLRRAVDTFIVVCRRDFLTTFRGDDDDEIINNRQRDTTLSLIALYVYC